MPYCLACGAKTDFETSTCPSCGQAVRHRIDPPGDDFGGVPEPDVLFDEETDSGASDEADTEDAADESDAADPAGEPATEERPAPVTDPAGPSPFADRWSLAVAAGYPVQEDYGPVVVGGVVEFFALVLPFCSLFTVGYGFRLLRAVARGQAERPAVDDYGGVVLDGAKAAVVAAVYGVLGLVGALAAVGAGALDGPLGTATWIAVGVLLAYPLPASLTVYGATDDLRSAFARGHAGAFATSRTYLRAWAAWLAGVAGAVVLAAVSVVTLVGPLVVRAWGTYSLAVLWGYYYRAAAAREEVPPAPDEPVA